MPLLKMLAPIKRRHCTPPSAATVLVASLSISVAALAFSSAASVDDLRSAAIAAQAPSEQGSVLAGSARESKRMDTTSCRRCHPFVASLESLPSPDSRKGRLSHIGRDDLGFYDAILSISSR